MSKYDFDMSLKICMKDYPFYSLIMAAIRQADTKNLDKLIVAFAQTYNEFMARYNAPGGLLPEERCLRPNAICSGAKSPTPTTT